MREHQRLEWACDTARRDLRRHARRLADIGLAIDSAGLPIDLLAGAAEAVAVTGELLAQAREYQNLLAELEELQGDRPA